MKDDPIMFSHLLQRMADEEFLPRLLNSLLNIILPPSMLRPGFDDVPRALMIDVFWKLILAARCNVDLHAIYKGQEGREKQEEGKK